MDICNRIISIEKAKKPADYSEAILRMGEIGVLDPPFSRRLAPLAGFRNILVHEYMAIDWDEVYNNLAELDDLLQFAAAVRKWWKSKGQD